MMQLRAIRRYTSGLSAVEKASWFRTHAPCTVVDLDDGSSIIYSHSGERYVVKGASCECKAAQVGMGCYHVPYVQAEARELSPLDSLPF